MRSRQWVGHAPIHWHTRRMSNVLLLLPDLLLIVVGFCLCRFTSLDRPIWDAAEKLVYYFLFPVLLFTSTVRSPLQPTETASLALAGVALTVVGVGLAYAIGRVPGIDERQHASGAQVAFRFNSFIALALGERFGGAPGVAGMALLIALCVPIANVAAVWFMARQGGQSSAREILRNPLIVATVAGLTCNLLGIRFTDSIAATMQRIGVAALPIGLMAVGAGLQLGGLKSGPKLAAGLLSIRHLALPLVGLLLTFLLPLTPAHRELVLLFAAVPTASSCYVLAARMGGDGPYVAGLVTVSTLLGMVLLPIWIALLM
jgi:malonate transporter